MFLVSVNVLVGEDGYEKKLLPVKRYKMDVKISGHQKKISVLSHRVDLSFTITFYKIQ